MADLPFLDLESAFQDAQPQRAKGAMKHEKAREQQTSDGLGDLLIIEDVAHHRNGVHGVGFHIVTFLYATTPMVGIVFEAHGHVAVFERDRLDHDLSACLNNSWRGDALAPYLRYAIARYKAGGAFCPPESRTRSG